MREKVSQVPACFAILFYISFVSLIELISAVPAAADISFVWPVRRASDALIYWCPALVSPAGTAWG